MSRHFDVYIWYFEGVIHSGSCGFYLANIIRLGLGEDFKMVSGLQQLFIRQIGNVTSCPVATNVNYFSTKYIRKILIQTCVLL